MRSSIVLALAAGLLAGTTGAAPGGTAAPTQAAAPDWLLVSDLHFDPFADPERAAALADAPPSHWAALLDDPAATPSPYLDTNYALLKSALAAMQASVPDAPVVVIAGDFLAHQFPEQFARALPGRTPADYAAFVDKTVAFLAAEFDAAFPRARFAIALGNNDGYCGDYQSTPQSPFFAHMASAWEPLVNRAQSAPDFVRDFSNAGYYTATLPSGAGQGAQVVVLNSVFWSANYRNACGQGDADPGAAELDWLAKTSEASPGAFRWFLGHIPPGIDDYSSLRAQKPVSFMQPAYLQPLVSTLSATGTKASVLIVGHAHHPSFEIVAQPGLSGLPALIVPSISPNQGNDPAFVAADVDPLTGTIRDTTTYAFSFATPGAGWSKEYSFDAAYGTTQFDVPNLTRLQQTLASDPLLRAAFESYYTSGSGVGGIVPATFAWYWCGNVNPAADAYAACVRNTAPP